MDWKEKLSVYSESMGLAERPKTGEISRPHSGSVPALDSETLRLKTNFENNVRLVNAFFEECIHNRKDGESFQDAKKSQDLEFFEHLYQRHDPEKITRDLETMQRIKKGMEQSSFFARVVETVLWQAQKDYALFGRGARVVPTSEFDDFTKGVDLVVELLDPVERFGVDVTMKTRIDPYLGGALDAKSHLKFSRGDHEKGYFRRQGVFRRLDYLNTPTFSGIDPTDTANKKPGLDLPAVVLSLSEQDLVDYCSIVIDDRTKKPRDPQVVQMDPRFHQFRVKIFEALGASIAQQQSALQKQENIFRQQQGYRGNTPSIDSELAAFESDRRSLERVADRVSEEGAKGKRVSTLVALAEKSETPEEKEIMMENAAAAIASNHETLRAVVQKLKKFLSPDQVITVDAISQQEKDRARNEMITELLSGVALHDSIPAGDSLFSKLHDFDFMANAALIAGARSEIVARAKEGDRNASVLIGKIRTLANSEQLIRGFERMMTDMHKIDKKKIAA